ncbi:pyridoxamine 5'-phosphate oxidase [Flavobacterium sp. JP2137]|uniref:pyridoxamine 5'-phosphate oxidase n=1 Tax=Flavobacterium sp. JP2137 TaxID=3414510 RepID=UPI003D2FC1C9
MSDLSNYRKSYEKSALIEAEVDANPLMQFRKWFHEVEAFAGIEEVNAMSVSTLGLDGFPKARIVLLKKYDENGFVFFTNYDSEKGKALLAHPKVGLSFFWPSMERQVIIKGFAEKLSEQNSDNYFDSRPQGSKLGAAVSPQSEVIPSYDFLLQKLVDLEADSQQGDIHRPKHWGGFVVKPVSIEFWQGRPNRLHDRIRYRLQDNMEWEIDRLAP